MLREQITAYEPYRIPALDGGMVTSISGRRIDQSGGFSTLLQNFDTSMVGLPQKRPACVLAKEGAIPTGAAPTGLHYFKWQSEDKRYLIASSEDKVVAYSYENSAWDTVESGLDGAPVYFLTIADQLVYTNGVDTLRSWSDTLKTDLGAKKATARTYLLYANNDLEFTAKNTGAAHIRVQYLKAASKTTTTSVSVTGEGTEEAPYLILVNLAWDDEKILTTASQVKSAIEAHSTANSLISVDHVADSDGTREVTEMPERPLTGGYDAVKGKYLIEYRTRAVLADGSKLHVSHTGDPHLWSPSAPESNSMEVYVSPDDGESISGLLNMGDGGVLIGKPNALYGLFGYKRDNFVVDMIDPTIGVSSHKSMVYTRPYAYWVWGSKVYHAQPGGVPERISYPIQELLDEQVDVSRTEETTAFLYKRMYIVTFPAVGGGFVTYCYHVDNSSWGLWTAPQGFVGTAEVEGTVVLGNALAPELLTLASGVFVDEPTGHPIVAELRTVELDLGLVEQEKDIGDFYLVFRGTGERFFADIDVYLDGRDAPSMSVKDIELYGHKHKQIVLRLTLGQTARLLEVVIRNSRAQQFTPMAMSYTYQLKDVV